jgi:hypothetical protein
MDIGYSSWNAPAAYLYLLGLDAVSLAWEYLRRNASYQSHWQGVATGPADSCATERWGLRHLEDPRRDGRIADPLWHPTPRSFVWLTRYTEDDVSARFQFWRIPGDKTLVHDGARLRLTARRVRAVTRAMLAPDLVVRSRRGARQLRSSPPPLLQTLLPYQAPTSRAPHALRLPTCGAYRPWTELAPAPRSGKSPRRSLGVVPSMTNGRRTASCVHKPDICCDGVPRSPVAGIEICCMPSGARGRHSRGLRFSLHKSHAFSETPPTAR